MTGKEVNFTPMTQIGKYSNSLCQFFRNLPYPNRTKVLYYGEKVDFLICWDSPSFSFLCKWVGGKGCKERIPDKYYTSPIPQEI